MSKSLSWYESRPYCLYVNGNYIRLEAKTDDDAVKEAARHSPKSGDYLECQMDGGYRIVHRWGKKSGYHRKDGARRNDRRNSLAFELGEMAYNRNTYRQQWLGRQAV
jgi:hypothetical protein